MSQFKITKGPYCDTNYHIGEGLYLSIQSFDNGTTFVMFEYQEQSSDPWHNGSEISIDLTEDMAVELIDILQKAFDLKEKEEE